MLTSAMHYKIVISRGNFPHLFSVPIKILVGGLKICNKMNIFLRNTISNLYDVASAPEGSTRDALPEWIQIVFDTAYLLYQKTKQKLSYGQTLKNTVENNAEKKRSKKAAARWWWATWYGSKNKLAVQRNTPRSVNENG